MQVAVSTNRCLPTVNAAASARFRLCAAGRSDFSRRQTALRAGLGGGGSPPKEDKKFLTAEEEPDEFWQTKAEAKGGLTPAKDPLALIGLLGILLPFVILGIAIGTGYVDVAPKSYMPPGT